MHGTPQTLPRTTPVWPPGEPNRRGPRWIVRAVVALSACAVLLLGGFATLAFADYSMAATDRPDPRARAEWVLDSGDHLHFAFHILAGRVLDLCPCTRRAAGAQYYRADFHAVTPLQKSVADNTHPKTPGQWANYLFGPAEVTVSWIGDGIGWLGTSDSRSKG